MAKPNLALIPATIGDKVYSILPSDGVGDFDFTRGTKATRINAQGLIEEVASGENRLNYSLLDGEVVGCPHLLLEPSRTNYLPNSDNGSSYTVFSATRTLNQVISLDGTLNSFTLEGNGDFNQVLGESVSVTLPSAGDYTFSVFAKKGNNNFIQLFFNQFTGSSNGDAYFDLENGTTSSSFGRIENYGNGWYKCSVVGTVVSGDLTGKFGFRVSYSSTNFFFPTANDAIGKNAHFYGFQVEQGSYATSYIKTTSAAVTRAAETCNGSGNAATFNDSEGVLMAEISALADDLTNRMIVITDGTTANSLQLAYIPVSNKIAYYVKVGGVNSAVFEYQYSDITLNTKIAATWKLNDFKFYVNGFKVGEDLSGAVYSPNTLNQLNFKRTDGLPFYGKTKQIQYFDSILDSEQLEQLTSWDSFRAMAEGQLYTIE